MSSGYEEHLYGLDDSPREPTRIGQILTKGGATFDEGLTIIVALKGYLRQVQDSLDGEASGTARVMLEGIAGTLECLLKNSMTPKSPEDKPIICINCGRGPGRQNPLYKDGAATGEFQCEVCRTIHRGRQ